jgi:hypothetical protein
MACRTCNDVGPCQSCGGSSSREALLGTAGARGGFWAMDVKRKLGARRPASWPPFEGRTREIALRKVADLGGDEATREVRARHCWERARQEYEAG